MKPLKQQEVTAGFTIAELYQATHQDIAAGLYDEAGILDPARWTYDELAGTCTAAITLGTQQGRDRFAPTPTPPLDRLETYAYATGISQETDGTTTTVKTFPQVEGVRASYVQPTPGKVNRSPIRVDATSWNGWEGRPIAIVADGVAVWQTPNGTKTHAYLTVLTGPLPGVSQQTALARLPLPSPCLGRRFSQRCNYTGAAAASCWLATRSPPITGRPCCTYRPGPYRIAVPSICAGSVPLSS